MIEVIIDEISGYLNCDFKIQRPSPWIRVKSQISRSMDRKVAVSEFGSLDEKCFNSSSVDACPSNLQRVAIKSRISRIKLSWVDSWTSLTAYRGRE